MNFFENHTSETRTEQLLLLKIQELERNMTLLMQENQKLQASIKPQEKRINLRVEPFSGKSEALDGFFVHLGLGL